MANPWIDISVPLRTGMVHWPGDPPVQIWRFAKLGQRVDGKTIPCNVSQMNICAHAGTHMDGPRHFIKNGDGLDTLPLDATIGPARVIEIEDRDSVKVEELASHKLKRGERILLRTHNSSTRWWEKGFQKRFVHISAGAARHMVERGIQTIGVDYLSVGGYERDGVETHQILLGAQVWIIEGLDLTQTLAGNYDLVCLPVKVKDSDGAPARAVLRRRGK
jgi:arylformamidase